MSKRMTITIIGLVIVFGGLLAWNMIRNYLVARYMLGYEAPPVTISASQAKTQVWQPYLSAVGNFVATNGVDISAEAAGIVREIHFESGELARQGDLLIKLDDSVDQAELIDNEARLELAKITHARQLELYEREATPVSFVDEARAELRQMEALVGKTKAIIAQKHITAPFDGKLGIRLVGLGEYVQPGVTALVTMQSLDPLYLRFFLPEQNLKDLSIGQTVILTIDAYPDEEFTGEITAINAKVDIATHNIEVQATVPNPDNRLYPGVFANIRVLLPITKEVITVPHTAIAYSLYGNSVFVIKDEGEDESGEPILRAYRQYVLVGQQRGVEIAVEEGLDAGELVIDSGQLKLSNGARVSIDNSVKLERHEVLGR